MIARAVRLVLSIAVCSLAGIIGSFFTASSVSAWYPALSKPFFNPPSWVFGPVWTILYIIMGVSLYLVWNQKEKAKQDGKTAALSFFGIQLCLNSLWSVIFFGLKSPLFAFAEIILLWASIAFTIILFRKISKPAAWLLVPYILWVSFAAVLNFSIYLLN